MIKKIIFTSGGTGGHIFPAINLMKHMANKGYEVLIVTDVRGKKFTDNYSEFKSYILKIERPTNNIITRKLLYYFSIFSSTINSIQILKKEKPDLIFGFGGYASFPISVLSKLFNIPLVIYENNMILGRANKYLSLFSKKILVANNITNLFSKKHKKKIYKVGNILNKKIINYLGVEKKNEDFFSILVLGGSQGAKIFGEIIPPVIKMIKDKGHKIKINQQTLYDQRSKIEDFYIKNNIKNNIFDFNSDILKLITSSNLAITRCGASTTAELTHTLTPFIAVPLKNSVANHQYLNAEYYEKNNCCWILEQNNFNTQNLLNLILNIIENKSKLESASKAMQKIRNQNVYSNIEKVIGDFN